MTTVADGLFQYGGMLVFGGVPPFVGASSKTFFVDPVNGADGNDGQSPKRAFATLYRAHYQMTSGNNDVCYFIGNGAATGAETLSLANALAAQGPSETAATTGMLTWSKDACHLIGIAAPTQMFQRCKVIQSQTAAIFNSSTMVTFSGNGNYIANMFFSNESAAGAAADVTVAVSGLRNCFNNVHFGFPSGTAAIADSGSRALVITGQEDTFLNCAFGFDTVTRSTTNATVEFLAGAARAIFRNGLFNVISSSAGAFHVLGTGDGCLQKFALFDDCIFMDNSYAGGTALTVVSSFTTANPGGALIFSHSQCVSASTAEWGDANAKLQSRVDNVGGAGTAGIMLRPT